MFKRLVSWLIYGACAVAMAGAGQPLVLENGRIETASESQQAMYQLLKSTARAPMVQRPTARGTGPWLVQFNTGISEETRTNLHQAGGLIHGYIPANGLLVEATPGDIVKIGELQDVAWLGEYLPDWKLPNTIRMRQAGADEACEYMVWLFSAEDKSRLVREFGELPGASVSQVEIQGNRAGLRVWLSIQQVEQAAGWGEIEWIEPCKPARSWGAPLGARAVDDDLAAAMGQTFDAAMRILPITSGWADAGAYSWPACNLDGFIWEHPDMLVVAAAGNAATDTKPADGVVDSGSVGSPATAKNVLSVGAMEGAGNQSRTWRDSWPEDFAVEPIALDRMTFGGGTVRGLAAFSGRGPCTDGRIKPDLVAPGTFVEVARADYPAEALWAAAGNTRSILTGGTGVAASQVAAAAEKMRQWLLAERGLSSPSAALIKALLISAAQTLAPGQYGTGAKQEIPFEQPNPAEGWGGLDAARLALPGTADVLDLHDGRRLATGQVDTYPLEAGVLSGSYVLVLAYSDYPAAPAAGTKLVNNLDLSVKTPGGAILHANGRSGPDDVNNVEMIMFNANEKGRYEVRVEAPTVPMGGTQPYALVIRGPRTEAADAAALETP